MQETQYATQIIKKLTNLKNKYWNKKLKIKHTGFTYKPGQTKIMLATRSLLLHIDRRLHG